MSFRFELATPADEGAIRRLLAENPVPGHISIRYEREPDYFLGCDTMGPFWQLLVARHEPSGALAGIACRATRPLFVNGRVEEVGYLSQLRVAEPFRGRWLLSRGFHRLRELHEDGRVRGYLATIIAANREAQGLLVQHPRRHFPAFRAVGGLVTLALPLRRGRTARFPGGLALHWGDELPLGDIVAFWQREGARRQFFPCYSEADFQGSPLTRDFALADLAVACRGSQIVGVMGLWSQGAYKQSIVHGYQGALGWARPLLNLGLRALRLPALPAPGEPLPFAYASFTCIAQDDPVIFRALLDALYTRAAQRGHTFLMLGLSERAPLLPLARRYPHVPYHSYLYTVCWEEGAAFHDELDTRIPYVELASL